MRFIADNLLYMIGLINVGKNMSPVHLKFKAFLGYAFSLHPCNQTLSSTKDSHASYCPVLLLFRWSTMMVHIEQSRKDMTWDSVSMRIYIYPTYWPRALGWKVVCLGSLLLKEQYIFLDKQSVVDSMSQAIYTQMISSSLCTSFTPCSFATGDSRQLTLFCFVTIFWDRSGWPWFKVTHQASMADWASQILSNTLTTTHTSRLYGYMVCVIILKMVEWYFNPCTTL